MGIVTTYTCDISGKTGIDKKEFVDVTITGVYQAHPNYGLRSKSAQKVVHIDIAKKFGLVNPVIGEDASPEITFESKLKALLEERVAEIAQDYLDNQ